MELGTFMQPVHRPDRNYAEVLQEDREMIILADQLGFSECWIGEHMTATVEPIPAPLAFCASLIDQTKTIKFGTGVICMPQTNPVTVASQVAMFDNMAKGRFLMGIGPGSLSSDLELYNVGDPAERAKMVQESIDIVLRLWSEKPPFDIKGKYWNLKLSDVSRYDRFGVGRIAKPYQLPHPPLAISIVTPNSPTAKVAGKRGWLPISGNFIQPRYVKTHLPIYLEGCAEGGRPADPSRWRVARSIMVMDSDAEAEDYVAKPDGVFSFYFEYLMSAFAPRKALFLLKPDESVPDEKTTPIDVAKSMVTAGTPDTVLDKLIAFRDEVGPFGTLLYVAHDWDDAALWKKSMRLLAEKVMPRFRQHCDATAAAAD